MLRAFYPARGVKITYEVEMMSYGFAAVRGSMQALQLHVADSRLMAMALLRSMHAFFALQRFGARKAI